MPGLGGPPACHMKAQSKQATHPLNCVGNAVPQNTTHVIYQRGIPAKLRPDNTPFALHCTTLLPAKSHLLLAVILRLCQTVKSFSRWGFVQCSQCIVWQLMLLPMTLGPNQTASCMKHPELAKTISHRIGLHAVNKPQAVTHPLSSGAR